jgi:hypothetical protein
MIVNKISAANTRIIDQYINPTKLLERGLDQALYISLEGDVCLHRKCLTIAPLNDPNHLFQSIFAPPTYDDPSAFIC